MMRNRDSSSTGIKRETMHGGGGTAVWEDNHTKDRIHTEGDTGHHTPWIDFEKLDDSTARRVGVSEKRQQ